MQDFFLAANPTSSVHSMLSPADIDSALCHGKDFRKKGDFISAETSYWQGFDQAVLDEQSHHLRSILGESQGVIGRAQELTYDLLLELGYLYEDLGEYDFAACCYKKAIAANKYDTYVWQRYHEMTDEHDAHFNEETWARLMERVSLLEPPTPCTPESVAQSPRPPATAPSAPASDGIPVFNAA